MTTGKKLKSALKEDFVRASPSIKLSQGEILKIIREKNLLTQAELAKLCGLTQATISSLENSRVGLGVERAKSIARALKVHPAVLVFPDWDEHLAA